MKIFTDCRFFRGDIPCVLSKQHNVTCEGCLSYEKIGRQILIIKLGAIGDVIRTTPLLRKIRAEFPDAYIWWVTETPDILTDKWVDKRIKPNFENVELLKCLEFDWLINLDKDPIAIALAAKITAKKKSGFTVDAYGRSTYFGSDAEKHKWVTGAFDSISRQNTKHYVQEILEIAGYEFAGEEYILEVQPCAYNWDIDKTKKVIGLNTGCGIRWHTRLWPENQWIELVRLLINYNYEVVLLGGADEDEKNKRIAAESGAKYFGIYPLKTFFALMDKTDLVVSAVSMGFHVAVGLKKKLVLFNNIFNKNEFYLYGRGIILEPDGGCTCYFAQSCDKHCMDNLMPAAVLDAVNKLLI